MAINQKEHKRLLTRDGQHHILTLLNTLDVRMKNAENMTLYGFLNTKKETLQELLNEHNKSI